MTLSVTSASSALAALQALQLQSATASGSNAVATPSTAAATLSSSPSLSVAAPGESYSQADSASRALSAADAANAAGQTVLSLLQQLRDTAGQASDPNLSSSDRAGLDQGFQATAKAVGEAVSGAKADGANLLDGSFASGLKVALGGGASASLTPQNLTLQGPTLGVAPGVSVATATAAASAYASLGQAIGAAGGALSTLQGQADQISAHLGFVQTLDQTLASPGDDDQDSVRLLALQVSQQLSTQSTGIASQSPQSVLSLFRS